jgi:hypothetical protein
LNAIIKYFKNNWFPLLLLFIGLHISFFQITGYDLKNMTGDLGDSRFILCIVEYNYKWLTGHYSSYWDGFFMYPDKEVISYSDNLLGSLPLYAAFRMSGIGFLGAFQLLILSCHVLNFALCYFCLYRLSGNRYGAACGAFIFAFSIALNGMHYHPQYSFRFCIPLFFYFLFNYLNTKQLRALCYAALFLVLQFYLGIYLGYFLLITGGIFAGSFILVKSMNADTFKKLFVHLLVVIPLSFVALLPLFYFYYRRNQITGYYTDYDFYMQTLPRLSSYFKSFPGALSWDFLSHTQVNSKYEWLHQLFPGGLVLLSLLISCFFILKQDPEKHYRIILLCLFIFMLFTINIGGHTLYGYLMKIPGIKAARVVSRSVTVLLFFAGWLFCMNVTLLQERFGKYRKIILVALPCLLLLDNYCLPSSFKKFDREESYARILNIEHKIRKVPNPEKFKAFAWVPGITTESHIYHIDAMLAALDMNSKTVNGYSSSAHKQYGPFWRNIDSLSLADWCEAMRLPLDSVLIVK